jgi:hypothetical protein
MGQIADIVIDLVAGLLDRRDRQPPAPPARRGKTAVTSARRLYQGAMVLTTTSPYRYRVERVVWIEKQPLNGPVVANLEGTHPETGAPQQRWHRWEPSEMVTVFTADVDPLEHGGGYDELLERYGRAEHKRDKQKEEVGAWQRVSKIAYPE